MSLPSKMIVDDLPEKPEAHKFDPRILREYDIRGLAGDDLSPRDAYALGNAFGSFLIRNGGSNICVACDGRESSPALVRALIKGLLAVGVDVYDVGRGPTPLLYFAVKDRMTDAGVMVTGSHNPPEYNGFKMTLQHGPVYGELVQELGRIAADGEFETGAEGKLRQIDVKKSYIDRLLSDYTGQARPLNVAWDCGNGAACEVIHDLISRLPGEHTLLFDEIDGTFPNHDPDPTVDANLTDLIAVVKDKGCDLGIAFDGDADRVVVVDERGKIVRCDMLIAIYANGVLEDRKGAPIIGDVKCSQAMFDEIERLGGRPVMWKTGHSLIKAKMAELRAPLAGELSGHIFFADKYYGFDDGLYCAIRLLNEVADTEGTLSSLMSSVPDLYSTPEIRFEVDDDRKFDIVNEIAEELRENTPEGCKIVDIDGVRVVTESGWWLLRASNTQNVLVTRAEANDTEHLEFLKKMVRDEVEKKGYTVDFPK